MAFNFKLHKKATMKLGAWDFKKRAIYTLICMQMPENFILCLTFLMEYFWTTRATSEYIAYKKVLCQFFVWKIRDLLRVVNDTR